MVQLTSLQAATFDTAKSIEEKATQQKWQGRVVSREIPAGVGSGSINCNITHLFINLVLPFAALFGAVFVATESFAIAGATTASTLLLGLFLKHACGL